MSRYMTREGFEAIRKELDLLWTEERPRIVREVTDAAELGDRSENAAYIYGKKRLREIDSRMRYLKNKLEGIVVVDVATLPPSTRVKFGAVVVVESEDGKRNTWRLVDKDESDAQRGRISVQSPIGRALLGREAGDCATVEVPKGTVELEIVEVRYGPGEP